MLGHLNFYIPSKIVFIKNILEFKIKIVTEIT